MVCVLLKCLCDSFPPCAELGGALDAVLLMEFVDAGNDLLLILAPTPTDEMRDVATALGVDLDAAGSRVLDHTRYDAGRGHAAVLGVQSQLARVFSGAARGPLVFSGMGLSVAPTSELTMLALHGAPTAYSAGAGGKPTGLAGCALGLAALAQARNNARALVLAGLDFVSNDLFDASVTDADGNRCAWVGLGGWMGVGKQRNFVGGWPGLLLRPHESP